MSDTEKSNVISMEEIRAAQKKLKPKQEESYLEINISFTRYVLPMKQALQVVELLSKAEILTGNSFDNSEHMRGLTKAECPTTRTLTFPQYSAYKIKALLGITYDEAFEALQ